MKKFYTELLAAINNSTGIVYTYYGVTHTYDELLGVTKKVCDLLDGLRNENIILYSSKSFEAYGAIYAILFSGNTWVPMSPDQSLARNLEILKITSAKLVLSDCPLPELFQTFVDQHTIPVIYLNTIHESIDDLEIKLPDLDENEVAYIMFTSGSTGTPKGVPMTHANYIKQGDVFSDYHDFVFDISIFYLFCCPLTGGAFAPVVTQEDRVLPLRFMIENKVTVWSSVPSAISRIQSWQPEEKHDASVRIMFLCGEPFSLRVLRYCREKMSIKHVYNFYGLTETGVENFYHECRPEDLEMYEEFGFVPIGRPLPGNEVRVTEDKELLVGGVQVTPGYVGGIGCERFSVIDGERWFHTGDIVERYGEEYFCKGRMDSQVKLSGYRVELMDIEANIRRFGSIDEAVCFISEIGTRKMLNAAIKPGRNSSVDIGDLKKFCSDNLPSYMVPHKFFICNEMPVNNNGKIDRRKIKEEFESRK